MHSMYPDIVDKGHRWPAATGYGVLRIKTDRLDPASLCFATGFQRLANAHFGAKVRVFQDNPVRGNLSELEFRR